MQDPRDEAGQLVAKFLEVRCRFLLGAAVREVLAPDLGHELAAALEVRLADLRDMGRRAVDLLDSSAARADAAEERLDALAAGHVAAVPPKLRS